MAFQYADDTTFMKYCAPSDLDATIEEYASFVFLDGPGKRAFLA